MAIDMIPPADAPAFLDRAGWAGAAIRPLAGDASFRRYFRVCSGDRTAVLMDAPPPHEDPRPFVAVADYLRQHGFGAPLIMACDLDAGLLLLEDFGDMRMRDVLDAQPDAEDDIYTRAVSLLARLHALPPGVLPPYDRAVYVREADLLIEYYCPAAGIDVDIAGYRAAWDALLPIVEQPRRPVTVLRDYHAENIMLVDDPDCLLGLGLLDFQDALVGHPAYDLVSLLQDARRDVDPAIEAKMIALYRTLMPCDDDFGTAYAVLGAQRNAKIIGIFTRLWRRDGKDRYLSLLPRMWGLLERDLDHPALAPLKLWFDTNIPASIRATAMVTPATPL